METFKVNYSAKNIMLPKERERERVQDQTITENRMYHWKKCGGNFYSALILMKEIIT